MSARRVGAGVLLLAAMWLQACSGGTARPTPEEAHGTPAPVASVGAVAQTATAAVAVEVKTPPVAIPVSAQVPNDIHEMALLASAIVPDLPAASAGTTAPAGQAASRAVRVTGARARTVDRASTTERRVALTFDAGADRGYTEQILDTLRVAGVKASFGITGQWAEANPDLVRRMVADGHHLINHTYSHDSFTGFSTGRGPKPAAARARELAQTEQAVQRIAGASTKPYFRPPYGDLDRSVAEDVYAEGYEVVAMWTVDSQGWNGLSRSAIEARCLRMAAPGAIYIFHVGSAAQDGPALPAVIDGLRERGFQMGTLDWLLRQ